MFATAEKSHKPSATVQRQQASPFFARKHEGTFTAGGKQPFFSASFIQPKLNISQPGDPGEKEADRMADRVMTMPEPASAQPETEKEEIQPKEEKEKLETKKEEKEVLQRSPEEELQSMAEEKEDQVQRSAVEGAFPDQTIARQEEKEEIQTKLAAASSDNKSHGTLQRKEKKEEEKPINRKAISAHAPPFIQRAGRGPPAEEAHTFKQQLAASKGAGESIPAGTRSFMESRFQADFSGVRIHTGGSSVQMNRQIHAQAFTHGNNIYFNSGKYAPETSEGQRLLAHELTHTIQQGASPAGKAVSPKREGNSPAVNAPANKIKSPAGGSKTIYHRKSDTIQLNAFADTLGASIDISGKTGGMALSVEAREYLQDYFKADLGDIRIHTDSEAQDICKALHVAAFTQGKHILIRPSRYDPDSEQGAILLSDQIAKSLKQRGIKSTDATGNDISGVQSLIQQITSAIKEQQQALSPAPVIKESVPGQLTETGTPKKKGGKKKVTGGKQRKAGRRGAKKGKADKVDLAVPAKRNPLKSPSSPAEDPAFQRVIKRTKVTASKQKAHDDAGVKAADAQKAAEAVPKEADSKAQNRKTDSMGVAAQKDLPFDAASFKADLLKKIEDITPETLEEATEFKENNKIGQVKSVMGEKVASEKGKTTGPVTQATAQPLQVNDADNKQALPLPPTSKGSRPAGVGATEAAPKPKLANEISLEEQSQSLDEEMAANNVTEEQLANSNEPSFAAALDEKRSAQKDARERPVAYRKDELLILKDAKGTARQQAAQSLTGMHGARGKNFELVVKQQQTSKQKDEERRAAVVKEIEDKYQAAEVKVNKALTEADTESNLLFDQGSEAARQEFENYVDEKMRAYKRRRYSGFWGGLRWAKDKLFGMPGEVNVFYTNGRKLYLNKMDMVITQVANTVTTKLNEAKQAITEGKKDIDTFVKQLPKDLESVGKEAASSIQDKFDALEQSVLDKREQLIEGLAKKYVDNVKKLDERINEMKEANKGLIDKAIGFLKKVWQVIKNLVNLFTTILSRLASIIGVILDNPSGFFDNLGVAFNQGFNNFKDKFPEYLEMGLMEWLATNLGIKGLEIPKKFDAAAIFSLSLQVMGITKQHIRERAVVLLGEEKVSLLETAGGILYRIYNEGIGAIWDMIAEKLSDIKEMVWEAIKSFIQRRIIEEAIKFILSLLSPIGAFIKVCIAIYDFLMMLVRFKDRIVELLDTILNAVMSIASGAVDAAAKAIEFALAKSITIIIAFLAALLRLNNIAGKVREIILRIQKRVEKAIDFGILKAYSLIGKTVEGALRIKQKGKEMVAKGKAALTKGLEFLLGEKRPFTVGGRTHTLLFMGTETKAELMVATTPKPFLTAVQNRETEINKRLELIKDRSSQTAIKEREKLSRHLQLLSQAKACHQDINSLKTQILQEKKEDKKAALQREIFTTTDLIKNILKQTGVEENDFALEIVTSPVTVGDKIFYSKKYYKVTEVIQEKSRIVATPININTGEARTGHIGQSSAWLSFEDFGTKFSLAGANVPNLSDEKLQELNYENGKEPPFRRRWNTYEGEANKILNHRVHNFQRNPPGCQWEHEVEQSTNFDIQQINSVENLYLAKVDDNQVLGRIFGSYDKAKSYLQTGEDSFLLNSLRENGYISPRGYLLSKPIDEHRRWKRHFYKKLNIAPVRSDQNIHNRGPFRTMNNVSI